jgi:ubiquinone/menaquinone biosynthesis C-methylase UbiE
MKADSLERKSTLELLLEIENEQNVAENANELLCRLQNDDVLHEVLEIIGRQIVKKNDMCNLLAVVGFEKETYDPIIPLLNKALEYDPLNKDTLINLSIILANFGEGDLAISYASKIKDSNEDVIELVQRLLDIRSSKSSSEDILNIEQDDVEFTGERIIINEEVKNKYNNVLEEHLHRYRLACQFVEGKMVLDAACGAGYGSKMLHNSGAKSVVGVDISEESLHNAQKVYGADNIDFVYGDVNNLVFEDASFDVVVSFETIEHIDHGQKWIRESARVLKDEGLFLVSTPNRMISNPGTYFEEQPINPHHRFEYSIIEFVGELLREYDVVELYGQTFSSNYQTYTFQVIRQLQKLNTQYVPNQRQIIGHELVSLSEVKDMQPEYIVALCRKKTKKERA